MYDIYAQRSNYPFKGEVYTQPRYFQEDTTLTIRDQEFVYHKGDKNPWFKQNGTQFVFNITSMNIVDKKQPLSNFLVKSEQMAIDTKTKSPFFVQGGYIGYDGRLWVIKTAETEKGPQKSIYGFFNYNPLSTIKMLIEEVQE